MFNLWCFCKIFLFPIIIHVGDQAIAFTLMINNKVFGLAAIYASTNYISRRSLLNVLVNILNNHKVPWCLIGEYNVVLRAHKHKGSFSPTKLPMSKFQHWTNHNNSFHLPIMGASFTWSIGRLGNAHTLKNLDMAICNMD